jgi:hypothetical protein
VSALKRAIGLFGATLGGLAFLLCTFLISVVRGGSALGPHARRDPDQGLGVRLDVVRWDLRRGIGRGVADVDCSG